MAENTKTFFDSSYEKTVRIPGGGCAVKWKKASESDWSVLPLLMIGVTLQFSRNVQPLYPINANADGTRTQIQLVGPASGQLQCQGMLTPTDTGVNDFLKACGATCSDEKSQVDMLIYPFGSDASKTCGGNARLTYTIRGLSLVSAGLSISAQGGMPQVGTPYSFTFSDMEISSGS